jgi:predicted acetyltransferase
MNIYGKFGWNLFSGFREERVKCEKLTDRRTDDGRLSMTKAHMAYGQVS